jgi:hypothetical protein
VNNSTAQSGLLKPEVIKRRKQQNTLNIYMTFWVGAIQFLTNTLIVVFLKVSISFVIHFGRKFSDPPPPEIWPKFLPKLKPK